MNSPLFAAAVMLLALVTTLQAQSRGVDEMVAVGPNSDYPAKLE